MGGPFFKDIVELSSGSSCKRGAQSTDSRESRGTAAQHSSSIDDGGLGWVGVAVQNLEYHRPSLFSSVACVIFEPHQHILTGRGSGAWGTSASPVSSWVGSSAKKCSKLQRRLQEECRRRDELRQLMSESVKSCSRP